MGVGEGVLGRDRWIKGGVNDRPPFYLGQGASCYLGYGKRDKEQAKMDVGTIIE